MPKRKRSINDEFEHLKKKMKKLEQEVDKSRRGRRKIRIIDPSSSSSSPSSREASPTPQNTQGGDNQNAPVTERRSSDINQDWLTQTHDEGSPEAEAGLPSTAAGPSTTLAEISQEASTSGLPQNSTGSSPSDDTLDSLLLEILGNDPSAIIEHGPDIHKDLASRFQHIAANGLETSQRKELFAKYLIPSNCTRIAAPVLNAEIKAALPENMVKRDKGLEMKQKQLATAISCLASVMTELFTCRQVNQGLLQKLMDTNRMLCDMQHTDSMTRRNFAMFSVKREMKEHLTNTKIDKSLFGDNLSEALRTAKAVSKSGTDLKFHQRNFKKPATPTKFKPQPGKNLNWKALAPARRLQGPPPATRNREPAFRRNQHATSSRRSSPPPKTTRRR
ncbi:Uncharacterized protein OBRU01_22989 [Operophtera brumata]|uniref:Uncharacterized protein n=1 Tax=Operophtera brumata TaxID=104452 RepID=A0A0L7KQ94_OPEBR|nr:Uncharacterized protein OBRU01_22989 [Operophtera brumata]